MQSTYAALTFDTRGYDNEVLMALLGEFPFTSFLDEEGKLTAYILHTDLSESIQTTLAEGKGKWYTTLQIESVPDKNWNEEWERSFDPVAVNDFCHIRADFHPAPEKSYKHEVVIAPKMAFGTGHHATTWMMLDAMSRIDFSGKSVFDFGCGTGILSVVAALEGADRVIGVDIQPEAIENSLEHATLNKVLDKCEFRQGGIESAGENQFDVILANINLHVIEQDLEALKRMVLPGGCILLSGIMIADKAKMEQRLSFPPMTVAEWNERGEWMQLTLK